MEVCSTMLATGKTTARLMYVQDVSGTVNGSLILASSGASSTRGAFIKVKPVNKNLAATLENHVRTPGLTKPKLVSAYVTDGASVGTVSEDDSDFINGNLTNSGAGLFGLTFTTSYWTSTPHCWATPQSGTASCVTGRNGTTGLNITCRDHSNGTNGANSDENFTVFCHGY